MPFNISDYINSTNFGVYDSPGDGRSTISRRPYVERTYESYKKYLELRVACGYDADHGAMTLEVWGNCDWDAQDSMIAQYQNQVYKMEAEAEASLRLRTTQPPLTIAPCMGGLVSGRYFTHVDGFATNLSFVEHREDGSRFEHYKTGEVERCVGDSFLLEHSERRVQQGIWKELTHDEAFGYRFRCRIDSVPSWEDMVKNHYTVYLSLHEESGGDEGRSLIPWSAWEKCSTMVRARTITSLRQLIKKMNAADQALFEPMSPYGDTW